MMSDANKRFVWEASDVEWSGEDGEQEENGGEELIENVEWVPVDGRPFPKVVGRRGK